MVKKSHWLLAASTVLAAGSAMAADTPVKAPASAPIWSWAGFYVGAHAGYGWKTNDFAQVISTSPLVTLGGIESRGWVFGGLAGHNWQSGRWVGGLELDFSASNIRGDSDPVIRNFAGGLTITDIQSDDVKYLGTARARLGFVPFVGSDALLLYGTAGLAWERLNRIDTEMVVTPAVNQTAITTNPRDHFGWVVGVGGELRLSNTNWIARVEYLHYDFGTLEPATAVTTTTPGPGSFADRSGRQTIEVVRAALSYKFGDPAVAANALAANMPVKAPASAPIWSWAGFYVGAHAGYGWKTNDFAQVISTSPLVTLGGIESRGWVFGGLAGHNWQSGRWVGGLELGFQRLEHQGDSDPVIRNFAGGLTITDIQSDDVKYLGTARARLGFVPFVGSDALLLYGTAGLAWERLNRIDTEMVVTPAVTQTAITTNPRDHFGWVVGVGGELRLSNTNWIARVEYLHYDFGTLEPATAVTTTTPGPGSFADRSGRQTIEVVRAALSYKFGDPAVAANALAANMPVKALASAPIWSWAGFYVGAHAGYGWKTNDFAQVISTSPLVTLGGIESRGWVFGGLAGHNWQSGRWVGGLELDFSASNIRGDSDPVIRNFAGGLTITDIQSDDVKYLGTARARLGFVPFVGSDALLLYGTAGLAWERLNRIDTEMVVTPAVNQTAITTNPRDHFGWVVGVGGELRLSNTNWIARVEYLHYDFGTLEPATAVTTTTPGPGSFADRSGRQTIEVVRAALSYKFGDAR